MKTRKAVYDDLVPGTPFFFSVHNMKGLCVKLDKGSHFLIEDNITSRGNVNNFAVLVPVKMDRRATIQPDAMKPESVDVAFSLIKLFSRITSATSQGSGLVKVSDTCALSFGNLTVVNIVEIHKFKTAVENVKKAPKTQKVWNKPLEDLGTFTKNSGQHIHNARSVLCYAPKEAGVQQYGNYFMKHYERDVNTQLPNSATHFLIVSKYLGAKVC